MSNDDIPGTKPDCQKFKTLREPCNPLNPSYKLQSFEVIPSPVPKFIRDSINITDIDGTQPKKEKKLAPRDHYNVEDISGARPKPPLVRNEKHD